MFIASPSLRRPATIIGLALGPVIFATGAALADLPDLEAPFLRIDQKDASEGDDAPFAPPVFGPGQTVSAAVLSAGDFRDGIVESSTFPLESLRWTETMEPGSFARVVGTPDGTLLVDRGVPGMRILGVLHPGSDVLETVLTEAEGLLESYFVTSLGPRPDDTVAVGLAPDQFEDLPGLWAVVVVDGETTPVIYASEDDPSVHELFRLTSDDNGDVVGLAQRTERKVAAPDEVRRYTAPGVFTVLASANSQDPTSPVDRFEQFAHADTRVFVVGRSGGVSNIYEAGTDGPGGLTLIVGDINQFVGADGAGNVYFTRTTALNTGEVFGSDGVSPPVSLFADGDVAITLGGAVTLRTTSMFEPSVARDGRVGLTCSYSPLGNPAIIRNGVFVRSLVGGPPEDVNGDGTVDFLDLLSILSLWGTDDVAADLDGSGIVDFGDVLTLLEALA